MKVWGNPPVPPCVTPTFCPPSTHDTSGFYKSKVCQPFLSRFENSSNILHLRGIRRFKNIVKFYFRNNILETSVITGNANMDANMDANKLHERRIQNDNAIPKAWKLDLSKIPGLKLPLESNKNNIIALDLPRTSGIMSQRELDITESYSITKLLSGLAQGFLTSHEVTTAFAKRAAIGHQTVSTAW